MNTHPITRLPECLPWRLERLKHERKLRNRRWLRQFMGNVLLLGTIWATVVGLVMLVAP